MPQLRVKEGQSWKTVEIDQPVFRVGRAADNDCVIYSGFISRYHFEIRLEQNGYYLADLGSKLGTLVNGLAESSVLLGMGDKITVGEKFEAVFINEEEGPNTETLIAQKSALRPKFERLVALDGPLANQTFPLSGDITRIGRERDNEICLPLDTVSKYHAELVRDSGGFTLLDLNSGNGTFVAQQRIQRHLLKPGDLIRFDWVTFRFEDGNFRLGQSGTRIRRDGLGTRPAQPAPSRESGQATNPLERNLIHESMVTGLGDSPQALRGRRRGGKGKLVALAIFLLMLVLALVSGGLYLLHRQGIIAIFPQKAAVGASESPGATREGAGKAEHPSNQGQAQDAPPSQARDPDTGSDPDSDPDSYRAP